MAEETTTVQPGEKSPEQTKRERLEAQEAEILNLRRQWRQEWDAEQTEMIRQLSKPNRETVEAIHGTEERTEDTPKHRGVIRTSSPTEPLYRRLREDEQEWRSPDTDHWMAQWIRGNTDPSSNPGLSALARAKLDEIYGRADTLEGAAGADGAISDGTGGALLPRPLEAVVMIARDRVSKMRRFAGNFQMTRQTHTVPTIGAFTAYATAEAATATQGEGTIAEVQLTANKWQVKAIASREILEDNPFNLVSIYSQKAGSSLGAFEEAQFWRTGNGTAPNASAFAAGTAYTETTSTALGFVDVSTMYYTVAQQYRDGAAWFADGDVLGLLHRVTDAVNGRPFYQGLMDGPRAITDDATAVGTLMGKPVYEVDTTAGTIHFGDMSALYLVGSRAGIRSRSSEHALFTSDKIIWLWDERADGINVDAVSVQTCTGIVSASAAAA